MDISSSFWSNVFLGSFVWVVAGSIVFESLALTEKIMLSDFGLSKILNDPKMVECTPGGTSFYLPPEIIEGIKKHGARPRPTNVQEMKALDLWPGFN